MRTNRPFEMGGMSRTGKIGGMGAALGDEVMLRVRRVDG